MNVALTDLITNLPQSNNINNFTTNASNAKLESFDQKLQDIFSNVEEESLGFKNSPMPEKEAINNKLSVTLNTNDSKDLIISNTKKSKNIHLNVDQLLILIEASSKTTKNIDEKELLTRAQKILSSSKTQLTEEDKEVLQKAFSIIIKESKNSLGSNSEISLEGLIKRSKSIEESPNNMSQNSLHSKGSQETNQIVNSDIQKLLQLIEKNSKSIENKNEINTLEQAQKILSSSKTQLTEEDKEILQKAFNIIIKESKESKASNSEISSEGLIKHSKATEETSPTLSQNNLHSKVSQETNQIINSDIQKLLSTMEESSKNIENKNEINTLEQAQKILSSFKTEFTPDELNIIKTAMDIINTNNSKMGNSLSSIIEETNLITNSLIKGNTGKTKNNKNENNDSIKAMQFDPKADLLNTKNNFGKNVYFDPYETRKNNINKDKNSELQKDNTVKLAPTSNLENISKNLNIEQLKTNPSTNEIDLKSLQINKNNIQDGIPTTNLKDLNAQIKEVIISKNTQTFLNESFSVKISPPDLGKVDIQILKNGQAVTVNISTETENAKNIISKTLQSLVGNLRDEGYQPINIKVNVTQEEHYLADQNQQEQEQKKYDDEDNQNDDQPEEGTYYTFDDYLRSLQSTP
ncbi:MAG: flagellar hook-length control protein FliK [Thermotogota bacterium]|nr:flagellar hook-length control protein FliK [Thermotogota bacterium]